MLTSITFGPTHSLSCVSGFKGGCPRSIVGRAVDSQCIMSLEAEGNVHTWGSALNPSCSSLVLLK
jgi:hypothetical protein